MIFLFYFIQLHLIFSHCVKICEIWGQAKLLEFQRVCLRTCPWGDPNGSDSSRITMQYTVKRKSRPLAIFANTMQHACIDGIRDPILRGMCWSIDHSLSVYLHSDYCVSTRQAGRRNRTVQSLPIQDCSVQILENVPESTSINIMRPIAYVYVCVYYIDSMISYFDVFCMHL